MASLLSNRRISTNPFNMPKDFSHTFCHHDAETASLRTCTPGFNTPSKINGSPDTAVSNRSMRSAVPEIST